MNQIAQQLQTFKFVELFNQLGWDGLTVGLEKEVSGHVFYLRPVAQKRGVQILHCLPGSDGAIPSYAARQKIDRTVTADVREHLIIFTDAAQTSQVWQWVSRAPARPPQYREVKWQAGQPTKLLSQKLEAIRFTLNEEESLTFSGVTERLLSFDRDRVTKTFYKAFQAQRDAFQAFIDGIPSGDHQRWYTAVVIDRLMFVWFLQEKGFLNNEKRYLRNRLEAHLAGGGGSSFYKSFLSPLFFRGFAEERTETNRKAIEHEFGKVPYLNGGLFAEHELEHEYGEAIDIPDAAFSSLFAFFDEWDWHLDERPLAFGKEANAGKEINPDVLGYIFEKFVNQKQMGAYYTKEDITEYIAKNTIIPCLFEKVRAKHAAAFDAYAWPLLQADPRRYVYPAMLHGLPPSPPAGESWGKELYPAEIAAGLDTQAPNLLERRKLWNKPAAPSHGLPTEIWRETIVRHNRARDILVKLQAGEICNVADLITYNLNIRQLAQDVIERCADPALLRAFWVTLAGRLPRRSNENFRQGMSVLDPTCGSGAFLLAALQILKPLYQACLTAMNGLLADEAIAGRPLGEKWKDIEEIVARFHAAALDRERDYAITKHIIVHNLYGVDIEAQATEIAKLRLFLKLVALLEPGDSIEPLPDIDFNIRAGNTLVGYASKEETERAVSGKVSGQIVAQGNLLDDAWEDIRLRLTAAEQAHNNFQIQQVQHGGHVTAEDKQDLSNRLHELGETLNYHLCREYGRNPNIGKEYEAWKASHRPFHWYVDFYPIMTVGGFDVVIGNPPYVEYKEIRDEYRLQDHLMLYSSNLYAAVCFRASLLKNRTGVSGQIVPISLASTDRMSMLRQVLQVGHNVHGIHFGTRPGKLFEGAEQRLTIYIQTPSAINKVFSGGYLKWNHEERASLFERFSFIRVLPLMSRNGVWPKTHGRIENETLERLRLHPSLISSGSLQGNALLYYKNTGLRYFNTVTRRPPKCKINGVETSSSRETQLRTLQEAMKKIHCLLLSNTFYCWQQWLSNGRDLNPTDIDTFPVPTGITYEHRLDSLSDAVEQDYERHAKTIVMNNKKTGLVEIESLTPSRSKQKLDEIDLLIADGYGFSNEQLDCIINYDIKYRMGRDPDVND